MAQIGLARIGNPLYVCIPRSLTQQTVRLQLSSHSPSLCGFSCVCDRLFWVGAPKHRYTIVPVSAPNQSRLPTCPPNESGLRGLPSVAEYAGPRGGGTGRRTQGRRRGPSDLCPLSPFFWPAKPLPSSSLNSSVCSCLTSLSPPPLSSPRLLPLPTAGGEGVVLAPLKADRSTGTRTARVEAGKPRGSGAVSL